MWVTTYLTQYPNQPSTSKWTWKSLFRSDTCSTPPPPLRVILPRAPGAVRTTAPSSTGSGGHPSMTTTQEPTRTRWTFRSPLKFVLGMKNNLCTNKEWVCTAPILTLCYLHPDSLLRWLHSGSSNMAVIEVPMISGFRADVESLERVGNHMNTQGLCQRIRDCCLWNLSDNQFGQRERKSERSQEGLNEWMCGAMINLRKVSVMCWSNKWTYGHWEELRSAFNL